MNVFSEIFKTGQFKAWSMQRDIFIDRHVLNYLFWECTLRCNLACKHCGSNAGSKIYTGELSTEEIKKTFKEISQNFDPKKIMVAITGGEPLLRNDIFEVMSYANSLGFPWGMVTNGYLVNKEAVEKMKKSGMRTVVVSIDGIGKTHDEFRRKQGSYTKAINAVKLLADANFLSNLQITTSCHQKALPELEEMYNTFLPLGIDSWRVMNIDPIGRAEINKGILLNKDQVKVLLEFVKTKRKSSKIDITYGCEGFLGLDYEGKVRKNFFYCGTGINVGSILYNGDIFVCPNIPRRKELIQGNIRKDNFTYVWNNKFQIFRDKNRTSCKKCLQCTYWEECRGNSFHLWDFKKNRPKFCHVEMLSEP